MSRTGYSTPHRQVSIHKILPFPTTPEQMHAIRMYRQQSKGRFNVGLCYKCPPTEPLHPLYSLLKGGIGHRAKIRINCIIHRPTLRVRKVMNKLQLIRGTTPNGAIPPSPHTGGSVNGPAILPNATSFPSLQETTSG